MASGKEDGKPAVRTIDQLPPERQGALARWRLILGKKAEAQGIRGSGAGHAGLFGNSPGTPGDAGDEAGDGMDGELEGEEGEAASSADEMAGEVDEEAGMPEDGEARGSGLSKQKPGASKPEGGKQAEDEELEDDLAGDPEGAGAAVRGKGRTNMPAGGKDGASAGADGMAPGGHPGHGKGRSRRAGLPGAGNKPGMKGAKPGQPGQGDRAGDRGGPARDPGKKGQDRQVKAILEKDDEIRAMQKFNDIDNTLNFVYNPDKQRGAGLSSGGLSIPKWLENVKELFPGQAKEVLEKDLIKKSDIADLVHHPELFEKVEPSIDMVKTIISLKHMLPNDVKAVARKVVARVVEDLKEKLKTEVERHIIGAIKRDMHTPIKIFRNVDWRQSIRKNLKNYDPGKRRIIMAEPRFFSNEKRKKPWQIIVLIDESGSMMDSVIYSVVMASIFATLPALHTNVCIFDTRVVDLSDKVQDPVDILMSVQLGGGTDITGAVRYGRSLIKNPKKCIMVVISDFYDGRPEQDLIREFKQVLEGETKVLGLAALGSNARPVYNVPVAKHLNQIGIDVVASTPENLADIIGRLMER
ncbi:MAG: VWA domain-containing protein [Candidatus Lokiarchaeota archaeon]|nr:VWA domain-containing protein [Candidatus Lokiarchaeota archaeon]